MITGSFYGLPLNGHVRANWQDCQLVKKMTSYGLFFPNRFWKTSPFRALIAQDFARAVLPGNPDPEEAFVGGPGPPVARKIRDTHNGRIELKTQEGGGVML